jgi:hypothetical protein
MIMTIEPYGNTILPLIDNSTAFYGKGKTTIKLSGEQ